MKVFTGQAPFIGRTTPAAIASIISGKRPERPDHASFTDSLWQLTQQCWKVAPSDRPNAERVLEVLKKLSVFPLHFDSAHTAHRSLLGRAGQTALASPKLPCESLGQEAAPAGPPTVPSPVPAIHDIPLKTRVNGGRMVSSNRHSQTLKGGTGDASSRGSVHAPSLRGWRNPGAAIPVLFFR